MNLWRQGAFSICSEKLVVLVRNQMKWTFPPENVRKKWNTFISIPILSFEPECSEYHCTILLYALFPCSSMKSAAVPVGNVLSTGKFSDG